MTGKEKSRLPVEAPSEAELATMQGWSEERLVKECLDGSEAAWSALIDRYKNLIYSVPIKYRFSREEAADVFQAVCIELLSELPKIREPKALPKWILMVAAHKCYHLKNQGRREQQKTEGLAQTLKNALPPEAEVILQQAESEQRIREALASLPARCQELIRLLFFEEPARPYNEVARTLGLARGSIAFTRQRCLERLRRRLNETDRKSTLTET
jgi:RNA polymerase sigma factor (sigma-70 family)